MTNTTRHKLFVVPGTWEAVAFGRKHLDGIPDKPEYGMLSGITRRLDRSHFEIEYINYPGTFGPVAGGGQGPLDAVNYPSYRQSLVAGVDVLSKRIREWEGTFGLLGYSQGGAVVSQVGAQLVSGALARPADQRCLWVHAIASPHRARGRAFHLGNSGQLAGEGVSGKNIANTGTIDWYDYCLPGDVYGNVDLRGTYATLAYEAVIDLQLMDPLDYARRLLEMVQFGGAAQVQITVTAWRRCPR